MLVLPRHLEPGQTLGVVAPASAPPDPQAIDRAVAAVEQLGFKAKLAPRVRRRLGFLAGTDRDRAADLMRMFTDRAVAGILCIRGGYGTARLLGRLDYATIRAHPKVFVGYSDITSLHCALLTKARLVCFHGPMLDSEFLLPDLPAFTRRSFLRLLTRSEAYGSVAAGYRRRTVRTLRAGVARGPLVGGNLTLLCTTIGTPWQPPFRGRILFFEDLGEEPYRMDRMLTHLLNCGLLHQVAGIAIGINKDCHDPKAQTAGEYRQSLEDVFRERLTPLGVPVVMGLPFGHVPHNATLPLGVRARLDANRGELVLEEPAVR